jgi:hypothetical protein
MFLEHTIGGTSCSSNHSSADVVHILRFHVSSLTDMHTVYFYEHTVDSCIH